MTDPSPDAQRLLDESYESDLTEEESERLLLLCGHGIGPELSTAAQAVLDAVAAPITSRGAARWFARTALRTAAEQIENLYCESDIDDSDGVVFALRQLMLIAAELDALAP